MNSESYLEGMTPDLKKPSSIESSAVENEVRNVYAEEMESQAHDHEYITDPPLRDLPKRIEYIPRFILLALIRLYQLTFSRLLPQNTCRFYPSCSHYGYQAIYKHGAIKGSLLAGWRVLRCNPFNPGGFDPIP